MKCALCDRPARITMKYTLLALDESKLSARLLDRLLAPKFRACDEHAKTLLDKLQSLASQEAIDRRPGGAR